MKEKRGQIGVEYITIMGFVLFILISIIGISMIYSSSINDIIKTNQQYNCINKIISAAESIYYAGSPSKATINCYFPESIKNITIEDNEIRLESYASSGDQAVSFQSKVPINGSINFSPGLRNIVITAYNDRAELGT